MEQIVQALVGREVFDGDGEAAPEPLHGAARQFAQTVLDLGKHLLDRIEIGAVRGKEPRLRANGLDSVANGDGLVGAEVVHDNDVSLAQGGNKKLFNVGVEFFAIDGSVEDTRRRDTIASQGRNESRGFPVTEGRVRDQPLADLASAVARRHVGGGPGLVDEHQPARIKPLLALAPSDPRRGDVRALLLGGAKSFF